ncbi:MAG TPA: signal peptidase I [Methanobacteriaceae archaeon]|nr:signal peptidase I [Methanobacteriaceae archaeon]
MSKKRGTPKKKQNNSAEKNSKHSNTREIASYVVIIIVGIILAQHLNVVVSGSMEPVFYRGDVVLIEKSNFLGIQEVDPNNLKLGDIVIYHATWFREPVIHRIVGTGSDSAGKSYYVTKGDNNPRADPAPVYPEQVQSKVISLGNNPVVIPKIGYITLWIRGL